MAPRKGWRPSLAKRRAVAEFVAEHLRRFRYAPTLEGIAEHMGWESRGQVQIVLRALEEDGCIQRSPTHHHPIIEMRIPES